jgi:hypothetical protein
VALGKRVLRHDREILQHGATNAGFRAIGRRSNKYIPYGMIGNMIGVAKA